MRLMKVSFAYFALFFFLVPSAGSQTETADTVPLNFKEFHDRVQAHFPLLAQQNEKLEEALAKKFRAYAGLLPRIQGGSSVTTTDDPVQVFGNLLRQEAFTQNNFALDSLNSPRHRTNFNFILQGEMPVFNAFQTFSHIRASRHLADSEKLRREFLQRQASLLALEAYLKMLAAGELLRSAQAVETSALEDLKQAEDLKEKGMILGADFYAARVIAGNLKRQVHQWEAAAKASQVMANILMGDDPAQPVIPVGKLPEAFHPSRTVSAWIREAHSARKDLGALEAALKAQGAEVFRERASILPRISAFGAIQEDSHDLVTGGENFMMGFKGTLDLFDPTYLPRSREARHRYRAAEIETRRLKDDIASSVSEQALNYERLSADFSVLKAAREDSKQAVELTQVLYREGRKSIADLLEMRAGFFASTAGFQDLLSSLEFGYANLLFLSGGLDEPALQEIAERLGSRP